MKYTITATQSQEDVLTTTVQFEYKDVQREVNVSHFRPKTEEDIELGIVNRINSEMVKIDAIEVKNSIELELNTEKTLNVFTPSEEINPFEAFTSQDLVQKLAILSLEYTDIQTRITEAQIELTQNSNQYDLVIAELVKRQS